MSGRFVRASKYRHVFGQSTRREQCYDNLRISRNAWDTNLIKANPKYLAVNWEAGGGGAFAVIPLGERGKLPEHIPLFRGHTAVVLDTDWSPFDDSIIASSSDDGKVFLWQVPEDFSLRTDDEEVEDVRPVGKLSGHSRKVGHVLFNPAAENILASSAADYTIKIWDLEDGKPKLTLKGNDMITSLSWNADGSMLATTSRDKKLRFWDVRQEKAVYEVPGHSGAKNSRVVWMGDHDRVATTGFSKMSERQLGLWDVRNPQLPIDDFIPLDSGSGVEMPFWDHGSQILYLGGKGDGNIRYYEYQNDKFEFLTEYRSPNPQRGIAFLPKRGVNTHENEIARAFKTVDDSYIEPISFIVPRRAESFQEDIYPPIVGTQPAVSSPEWLGGKTALPPKFSMEGLYEGREPQMVPADAVPKPSAKAAALDPTPVPKAEPKAEAKPEPTPAPAVVSSPRGRDPMATESMSAMAAKFADKEDAEAADGADGDDSSFEEIQKPVERPSVSAAKQQAQAQAQLSHPEPTKTASALPPEPPQSGAAAASAALAAAETPAVTTTHSSAAPQEEAAEHPPAPAEGTKASVAAMGLREVLQDMRAMLQAQSKQIELLTTEVARLRAKVES